MQRSHCGIGQSGNKAQAFRNLDIGYEWEADAAPEPLGSGRVHHVALRCAGYDEMCARLKTRGHEFHVSAVPAANLRQVFIEEPNGITLELNFFGE